jgi:hypothetical protein
MFVNRFLKLFLPDGDQTRTPPEIPVILLDAFPDEIGRQLAGHGAGLLVGRDAVGNLDLP